MMRFTGEFLTKIAQAFYEAGITLSIDDPCGNKRLLPSEVANFLADKDAFFANRAGLSMEHYLLWVRYREKGQCTGTTNKNRRCKRDSGFCISEPDKFKAGYHDRCPVHRES